MVFPRANVQEAPSHMNSYSTLPQNEPMTVITRNSATQYLVLNSKDRFLTSQPSTTTDASGVTTTQPGNTSFQNWNNFKLQRPQNLMESFATRLVVSEIRFPMWIPNINERNNKLWVVGQWELEFGLWEIVIPVGFYTPTEFVAELNDQLINTLTDIRGAIVQMTYPPTVTLNQDGSFTWTNTNPDPTVFELYFFNPEVVSNSGVAPTLNVYLNNPSLCLTMGMEYAQSIGTFLPPLTALAPMVGVATDFKMTGNPTELLYSQFFDIVSDKLNYYTTNFDGSSDAVASRQLLCRLYLSDETSTYNSYANLYKPFIIHRQFKNPKEVMWNKDAVVDWLDIGIYDQFGQLVPLPSAPANVYNVPLSFPTGSYPDFQITLLATES
jgi:hypothetical protein